MEQLFDELKEYLHFDAADEARLRALKAELAPHFQPCVDAFYARILEHPDARSALERGERKVGSLKITLLRWMEELFEGPWDAAYLQRRARIGVVHVRIGLPQHYMITAMHLVRARFLDVLVDEARRPDREALQRVLDLDLALMLHTYRQDMEAKQAKAERLATYGALVGSIGHELRNPLGVIETSVYLLRSRGEPDPKVSKHLDRISGQVTVANSIITQLLDLIRDRPLDRQPVALNALIAEASQAVPHAPEVVFDVPDAPQLISGDPTMLRQVVVNLLDNAVQAVGARGQVSISVSTEAEMVVLRVDDSGAGIDHAIAQRLFEPLVTTKAKGIGLGLALVKRIVERHGGTIDAERGPLGGARFTVRLPEHRA